ncbi:hypothetical protein B1A85_13545 [Chroococcidiopsis sp. TS-821]|nr:hypothetical protein B1A85_13545 [Chroococcidiopsis sp. TS-821]
MIVPNLEKLKSQTTTMHFLSKIITTLVVINLFVGIGILSDADFAAASPEHQHHASPMLPTEARALTSKEISAERFVNQGLEKLHQQSYQAATQAFTQALQLNSNHDMAYIYRGDARQKIGDYQGAVEDYTLALQGNPNFAHIYNSRGDARVALGDYQGAIADYTQAIKLYPEDAFGYSDRGAVYFQLGNMQKALEDLNKAIETNPGRAEAYFNRAQVYAKLKNRQATLKDYQIAIQLYTEQGNILGRLRAINLMKHY